MLASLVAEKSPEDLKDWALERLRGTNDRPLLYGSREPEAPHEAVAACLKLDEETLPQEKRAALIGALKISYRELHQALTDGTASDNQLVELQAWAEVVEAAKPSELSKQTSALLHACNLETGRTAPVLAQMAAAAAALPEAAEDDDILWRRLLEKPQSAALAFRRLLPALPLAEAARIWVELLRRHVKDEWPANPRLLLVALLKRAEQPHKMEVMPAMIFEQLKTKDLFSDAFNTLQSSRTLAIREFLKELQKLNEKHETDVMTLVDRMNEFSWGEPKLSTCQSSLERLMETLYENRMSMSERRILRNVDQPWVGQNRFFGKGSYPRAQTMTNERKIDSEVLYMLADDNSSSKPSSQKTTYT